jgi:hypothetical protein
LASPRRDTRPAGLRLGSAATIRAAAIHAATRQALRSARLLRAKLPRCEACSAAMRAARAHQRSRAHLRLRPGRVSTVGARHARVAYGRGCETLRGVASSGDRSGPGTVRRLFPDLAASVRGARFLLSSDSRKVCARRAAIGPRHSRQCGSLSASSCVNGAAIRRKLARVARRELAILQQIGVTATTTS